MVYFKEDVYEGDKLDVMPDITVYFDNLHYGANEALGHESIYSLETVKGPDDSNHGEYGILVVHDPQQRYKGKLSNMKLEDLAPLILDLMES